MRLAPWIFVFALLATPVVAAETPTETVRRFYDRPGIETDDSMRGLFVDPALTKLNQDEAIRKSGQGGCLDPGLAVDNAAPDPAEIASSLKLAESVSGEEAKVIAGFTVAGDPHRMEWKLKRVDGQWKIYDLLSVTGEWALSQFGCE